MTREDIAIISNRMKTVLEMYNRNNTINAIAIKTGLTDSQVSSILSANNYWHGILRTEGTSRHPIDAIVDYNKFAFLLKADKLDIIRFENERK